MPLPADQKNPWRTVSSRPIYKNAWISLREDQVVRPDGNPGIYGVVESRIATGVVAITESDEIILVGQYRYPTECYSWEIPEGGSEIGEDPLSAIQRELAEEAGLRANNWQQLGGEVHLSNCFSAERALLYLASDLSPQTRPADPTEVLEVARVPFLEALELVDRGLIVDAMSIIGILRAARVRKIIGS